MINVLSDPIRRCIPLQAISKMVLSEICRILNDKKFHNHWGNDTFSVNGGRIAYWGGGGANRKGVFPIIAPQLSGQITYSPPPNMVIIP